MTVPGVRDLVEAEDHARRRLVSALVSGDPLPAEPARPGRAVVAGVALGVITLAVGLLLDALSGGAGPAWPERGLVVSRDDGSAYVVLGDAGVHPVTDGTSARLLLGGEVAPVLLDQSRIDAHDPGERIGIAGAPAAVPSADRLVEATWSACAPGQTAVTVGIGGPATPEPSGRADAVLVRSGQDLAVVTADDGGEARAYPLPGGPGDDNLLLALGLPPRTAAVVVPRRWLALPPPGGTLSAASFLITGVGDRPVYAGDALPGSARVGDWFPAAGGARLLTSSGPSVLTPFALAVWRTAATQDPGGPVELGVAAPPALPLVGVPYAAAGWPAELRQSLTGSPCVLLSADGVRLGSVEAPPGEDPVVVEPGRGSLVRAAGQDGGQEGDRVLLVADDGRAYPVVGTDALDALGYAEVTPVTVPPAWLRLLERGPVLSVEAALTAPAGDR